jgi:DNA-binding MarR family transcriptional regulator
MEYLDNAKQLLELWRQISQGIKKRHNYEDMNYNEIVVCSLILQSKSNNQAEPRIQVKELSDKMKISRPFANKIINGLEDKGLIERVRVQGDRKSVYICLTNKAHEIYKNEKEKITSFANEIVSKLGSEDTKLLIDLLTKLNKIVRNEEDIC